MATVREALRANISSLSERIHEIKKSAFKSEKATKWAYVKPDGSVFAEYSQDRPDAKFQQVEYDKTASHINPKHANWHSYRHLRREASIFLTSMATLKALGEDADLSATSKDEAISALRSRAKTLSKARGQAGFRVDSGHAAKAWRRLKKVAKKAPDMVVQARGAV
jgi:hypothetical protein